MNIDFFSKMEAEIREAERACTEAYNKINENIYLPLVDIEKFDEEYKILRKAYKHRNKIRSKYPEYALRSWGKKN